MRWRRAVKVRLAIITSCLPVSYKMLQLSDWEYLKQIIIGASIAAQWIKLPVMTPTTHIKGLVQVVVPWLLIQRMHLLR